MAPIESNGYKAGDSPKLLREMLQYLGYQEHPLYKGFKEKLNDRVEWHVEVYIYDGKPNSPLIIEASGRKSSFHAGIRDAACQAIFRIREKYAHLLSNTRYRHFPLRRICNTKKEICGYNKHRRQHHGPDDELIQQQIRLTEALIAFCDDTSEELRKNQCKVEELEEELEALRCGQNKASSSGGGGAAPPLPHPLLVGGNRSRAAGCTSPQRKPAPARGVPCCGRRLGRGGILVGKSSGSSFCVGGSSFSTITTADDGHPQGQGDRPHPRPPPSTQKSFVTHTAVAVEEAPRRDCAPASSPYYEGQVRGKNLMPIIVDGGVALGKETANANNHAW